MQLADLICVCVLILYFSFAPENKDARRFFIAFFAVSVLALNRFSYMPYPELNVNFGALFLPIALGAAALGAGRGPSSSVMLGLVSGACGMLYNFLLGDVLSATFLMAFTSALLALALKRSDASCYLIPSLSPVFTALFISARYGLGFGYATVDTAAEYVLDAQVLGIVLVYILLSIKSFLREKAAGLS